MDAVSGADGCRGGWVCISRYGETNDFGGRVYPTAHELIHQQPVPFVLAIDVPIGLSESGPRCCDLTARKVLGKPRSCSVFPAPIRDVLDAESWEDASLTARRKTNHGISKQAWGIVPKVREVDAVLLADPALQQRLREVHPEVSFWAWNAKQAMPYSKKTKTGRIERMTLIDGYFGGNAYAKVLKDIRAQTQGNGAVHVGADDIADAFAALWTAERVLSGEAGTLLTSPPCDAQGLRMEIVY